MPDLLQIGGITERMAGQLDGRFERTVLFDQPDRAAFLRERGADFPAILTDGHWGVPEDVAAATPNLRVVSSYGVGYDAIDADAFAARGILIAHTPGVLNDEVAVTATMLWLAVERDLIRADRHARSGAWEEGGLGALSRSPMDRRVGILGMGRIGETIAAMLGAFRAEVHYHSRSPKDVAFAYHDSPTALAAAVDVLIVITPGGDATRNLVDADVLRALGPDGVLINVSRGSVVDEDALVDALEDGTIRGAGLDVFADEPRIPRGLKDHPRTVLTPHVGSATVETRRAMGDLVTRNLLRWLDEGTVETPVPECRGLNG